MASITTGKITDGGGTASIEYYATATYTRSGSKVTITVKCSVYGWGKYYRAYLNGSMVIDSTNTTVYKTFTYDNAAAKTYSFSMKAYLQTATGYSGYEYTETLTIDVPAASAQVWANVNGAWKKARKVYARVIGAWKEGLVKFKTGGAWKD